MAGTSLAAQAFAQLVGQGAGSGMAVMFLTTGTCGLLCCTAGYIALSCVLKKQNGMKKRKLNNGKVGLRSLLPQAHFHIKCKRILIRFDRGMR